jgi:hypothetical protein
MQPFIDIVNQLFELQQKFEAIQVQDKMERNMNRLWHVCSEQGISIHNPLGERYAETRTDCEANIVGTLQKNSMITQVIKPIVFQTQNGTPTIVQKAIVIVEAK